MGKKKIDPTSESDLRKAIDDLFLIPVGERTEEEKKKLAHYLQLHHTLVEDMTENMEYQGLSSLSKFLDGGEYFRITAKIGENSYNIDIKNKEDFLIATRVLEIYSTKVNNQPQ